MKPFFTKPHRWALIYSLFLIAAFTCVLLDSFVIPQSLTAVGTQSAAPSATASQKAASNAYQAPADAVVSDTSYEDENIKISIATVQRNNTAIYVADIQLADASLLKTALAEDTFGRNVKEATSDIAAANHAILAINGDYYGFRNNGYVLRNGVLYRDKARTGGDDEDKEDLVIDQAGDFSIISENEVSMESLNAEDIWQIFSFGPALVENGQITVDSASEVSQSKNSNPRTAIGQISQLHYVFIVADGRTSASEGLSILELAQELEERGCTTAYNLDGGGSSTMYFNGEVVNQPTDGRKEGEREVSDIVYIGY